MSLPLSFACITLIAGDTISKLTSSQIINFLPYARKEEESKAKVVYTRMSLSEWIANIAGGLLPLLLLPLSYWGMLCFPCVLFIGLGWLLKRRLGGYTGDCCGALFLLCELACWMGAVVMAYNF